MRIKNFYIDDNTVINILSILALIALIVFEFSPEANRFLLTIGEGIITLIVEFIS